MSKYGSCINFPDAPSCCSSCHNDAEDGYYELMDYDAPDGTIYYLCCVVAIWARDKGFIK